jgi:hypothetical protein
VRLDDAIPRVALNDSQKRSDIVAPAIALAELGPAVHVGEAFDVEGIGLEPAPVLPEQPFNPYLHARPSHIEAPMFLIRLRESRRGTGHGAEETETRFAKIHQVALLEKTGLSAHANRTPVSWMCPRTQGFSKCPTGQVELDTPMPWQVMGRQRKTPERNVLGRQADAAACST